MLRQSRASATEACARSLDDRAYNLCAGETASCDRAACFAALPASAREGRRAQDIADLGHAAYSACESSRRPNPEQAARAFLEHYYRAHSSAGQAAGESLYRLYGPVVTAYGKSWSRDQFVAEKQKYFRKYTNLQFTVEFVYRIGEL